MNRKKKQKLFEQRIYAKIAGFFQSLKGRVYCNLFK